MLGVLRGIGSADLAARSLRIARRLAETDAWSRADLVLCFLSMPREVDTSGIVSAARAGGKGVAAPRIEGRTIRFLMLPPEAGAPPRDRWGIPEPDPAWTEADLARGGGVLVVVPGLAFDRACNRVGRGKGFYDGFLREARGLAGERLSAIGVCVREQLVAEVPRDAHDQMLDGVVTEVETILAPRDT